MSVLVFPRAVRVYLATQPVNLRKSFNGLCNEVRAVLKADPLSGHVFIFHNRRRTMVKLLVWTRGGFTIVNKKLERGTFAIPRQLGAAASVQLDVHELSMLLEGLVVSSVQGSKRWEPPTHRVRGTG